MASQAKSAAPRKAQKTVKTRKSGRSALPLMIFIGAGSVVAPASMLVIACGMVPTIVSAIVNPVRVRGSIAAMFALNLAGVIPVLGYLWQRGHTINNAVTLLGDVFMWLLMYGGAGVAAFLLWGVPIVVHAVYEVQAAQLIRRLDNRRDKLLEEWGSQLIEDSRQQGNRMPAVRA